MSAQSAQLRSLLAVQAAVSYCVAPQVVHVVQTRSAVALQAAVSCVPAPQVLHGEQLVPLPVKPTSQAQVKPPGVPVLVQVACASQVSVPAAQASSAIQA